MSEASTTPADERDLALFEIVGKACMLAEACIEGVLSLDPGTQLFEDERDAARRYIDKALDAARLVESPAWREMCYIRVGEVCKVARYDAQLLGVVAYLRTEFRNSALERRLY